MRRSVLVLAAATLGFPAAARGQRWTDATAQTIGTTAEWTNKVELVDVDGDGWLDAILANGRAYSSPGAPEASRVFRNKGGWAGAPPFFEEITATVFGAATGHARVVKARDIDGDGDDDVLVGNTYGDPSRLYRRDPAGWVDVTATQLPTQPPGLTPWVGDADFGDVDADGDLDLVLADWGADLAAGAPPRLYLNDGAGAFAAAPSDALPATPVVWSWELDLADIDGDFDLDLLVASKGDGSFVYRNDGAGHFTDDSAATLPQHANNYEMEVMDVDGDGDVDLVTLNDGPGLRDHLFANQGGVFVDETATRLAGAANPSADDNMAAFVDVDADGDADLLVGSLSDPDRLLVNDGTGVFTLAAGAVPGASPGTLGIAFGDVDGDHRPDLLMGQGEAAFPDLLYRATDAVAVDTAPPRIAVEQIGETRRRIAARVHDGKTPVVRGELAVTLEYRGDATGEVPMTWYGELLWAAELPAPGAYVYRVCATDAAGNHECSPDKITIGAGDISTGDDAGPGVDASGPGGGGGGCCQTGSAPGGGLALAAAVAAVLRRRRRLSP